MEDVRRQADALRAAGYRLQAGATGFTVHHGETFVGGATTGKPPARHWRHRQANAQLHLHGAVLAATQHQQRAGRG